MVAHPHIDRYYVELTQLIEFGGVDNEENIRSAFQNCLAAYCSVHAEKAGARAGVAVRPQQQT